MKPSTLTLLNHRRHKMLRRRVSGSTLTEIQEQDESEQVRPTLERSFSSCVCYKLTVF